MMIVRRRPERPAGAGPSLYRLAGYPFDLWRRSISVRRACRATSAPMSAATSHENRKWIPAATRARETSAIASEKRVYVRALLGAGRPSEVIVKAVRLPKKD